MQNKIKECVRMIYNIIQSVTEKLSSLPYIEGIVLIRFSTQTIKRKNLMIFVKENSVKTE